jgi:pimeloyl-ACP methyl ester carboxylesterase
MPKAKANGIEIEYDCFGNTDAEAVLLISGLGTQMIRWSETFCQILVEQGYRVIRFDNRDAGLSTHFDSASMPDLAAIADAVSRGEPPNVPYTLFDMANDAVRLLDSLMIKRAHVVGRSMGGMIAQLVASEHADRVLSLVCIMSSTGNRDLPQARPEVMAAMTSPAPHPLKDEQGYLAHCVAFSQVIAGRGYPFDESAQRDQALVRLTKPLDVTPTDERAGKRKERLMDVCSSLMTDAQSAKTVKPPKGALDDPTPSTEPFA